MTHYARMPYYRDYWKEAGYVEEMNAVETADRRRAARRHPEYLTDRCSPT